MELLDFSFFSHKRDNEPKPGQATWKVLSESLQDVRKTSCTPETCKYSDCEEKNGGAWSPGSYPPGTRERSAGAVAQVCALVLDIDHVPSDDILAEYLDKIPYQRIIHASHSDRPGDRCVRVVIALSKPVAGKEWGKFWTNAVAHLGIPVTRKGKPNPNGGIDTQTKDASRLFFLPSRPASASETIIGDGTDYLFASVPGPRLDVDQFLHEPQQDPLSPIDHHQPIVSLNTQIPAGDERTRALHALAQAWPPKGQRHDATLALAGALAHANWPQDEIADFVQDLRDILYPDGDPTPTKAREQARDSVRKVQAGESVSGWPTLEKYVGPDIVTLVRTSVGLNVRVPAWLQTMQAEKASAPKAPTHDMLVSALRIQRNKLSAQRTKTEAQLDARMMTRILSAEQLQEPGEDRQDALDHALTVLVKYAPTGTTPEQLVHLLAHVFPIDIGQGELPWTDTLLQLIQAKQAEIEEEASETFEIALTGPNANKPIVNSRNLDIAMKKLKRYVCFDEFAGCEKVRHGDLPWETIEDHHVASLRIRIEETFKFKPAKDEMYDYITDRARGNPMHPPREYFAKTEPTWDGTRRIDTWLTTYCGAEDTALNRAIGRMVLIAAVRRVREPGCKFDEMLILEGEQGVQKSTGLKALCPQEDWFTDDIPLDADTKRQMEATEGKLIVEAGELKGMTTGDVNKLKGFLSRTVDKARMAYGRKETIRPRQFIIIGTTNNAHYLRDPTGNRRFWPVAIVFVDVDAIKRDRDQLWAEASHYESQGESIRLDPSLYAVANDVQEERRVMDPYEIILAEALAGQVGRIKSTDIWQLLGKDQADVKPAEQIRLGEVMTQLGWKWVRSRVKGQSPGPGTRVPHYAKGDADERQIQLGVSGRKVVRAAGIQGGLPGHEQTVKVN